MIHTHTQTLGMCYVCIMRKKHGKKFMGCFENCNRFLEKCPVVHHPSRKNKKIQLCKGCSPITLEKST
jgi:hypothetical protein